MQRYNYAASFFHEGIFVIKGNFSMLEIDPLDFIKEDIRVLKSCIRINLCLLNE